jgi:hypothetical protein
MNHYTFMHMMGTNYEHDARARHLWVYEVPQQAVGCEFLMQAILSFAALHLHIRNPNDSKMRLLSHQYFGSALRMLMQQISSIGPQNVGMAFSASVMIQFQVFMSWKDPCCHDSTLYQPPIQWLEMSQGVSSILKSALSNVQSSCMKPLVDSEPTTMRGNPIEGPRAPTKPGSPGSLEEYEEPFQAWGAFLRGDMSDEGRSLKKTFDMIHGLYLASANQTRSVIRRRLLTLPNTLGTPFINLLRDSDPRAMITLSYYFAVMKMSEDIWWFYGRPEFEINGVWSLLGEEWRVFMKWPRETIRDAVDIPFGPSIFERFHPLPPEVSVW